MMGQRNGIDKNQIEMLSLDQLVPENHLVRKLENAIDLKFIYAMVADLYSSFGAESIDPVVLIKLNIIQYTFGIRSMRQTLKEIAVNCAYRWYLGYGLREKLPHFSTFSKNYTRRFDGTGLFEGIFKRVLEEIVKHGFLDEESVFIEGTHVKASANNNKYRRELVEKSAKYYEEELRKEIDADREAHGKKPLKEEAGEPETKEIKASATDPDSGFFHKGEHKKVFAYGANVACDRHNYIMDFEVTAGNLHDSVVFPKLYGRLAEQYRGMRNVVADAGYKTPAICREIFKSGRTAVMPYKRPMTKAGFFKKYEYAYDEYYDCYICPNNAILKYSTTNREGHREYKSDPNICKDCPHLGKCTHSKNHVKVVTKHLWEGYIEQAEDVRHTRGMKEVLALRKETIERVFADAKELHGMRYAKHRGLGRVKMELTLLFTCMNLKKMAKRLWDALCFLSFYLQRRRINAV
jgi:transposase/IS5 family transposase